MFAEYFSKYLIVSNVSAYVSILQAWNHQSDSHGQLDSMNKVCFFFLVSIFTFTFYSQ